MANLNELDMAWTALRTAAIAKKGDMFNMSLVLAAAANGHAKIADAASVFPDANLMAAMFHVATEAEGMMIAFTEVNQSPAENFKPEEKAFMLACLNSINKSLAFLK